VTKHGLMMNDTEFCRP